MAHPHRLQHIYDELRQIVSSHLLFEASHQEEQKKNDLEEDQEEEEKEEQEEPTATEEAILKRILQIA